MKKNVFIISAFLLLAAYNVDAQVVSDSAKVETSYQNNDITFDGKWSITENGKDYVINGNSISNHSSKRSSNLKLEFYLVNENDLVDLDFKNIEKLRSINLGRIAGNGSSLRNVSINFDKKIISKYPDAVYIPILRTSNNAIKQLNPIYLSNGNIVERQEIVSVPESSTEIQKPIDSTKKYGYSFKKIDTAKASNQTIKMEGDLKLHVDYQSMKVILDGEKGFLKNFSEQTSKPLIIRVSLLNDVASGKGFNIAEYKIDSVNANTQISNFKYSTNILNYVPSGKYTPVILIAEDNGGKYEFKSSYVFNNEVSINQKM